MKGEAVNRDELKARIEKIRGFSDVLSFGETQAKKAIIEPICERLDWDTSDPNEVFLEYGTTSSGRVDYLFLENGNPLMLIEAKKPSESLDNHTEQILRYAFDKGVSLAVLTNGINWWLYLPLKKGDWETRKFYSIDLMSQEIDSICDSFIKFLSKENVISGKAVENAEKVFSGRERSQRVQKTIPEGWNELVSQPDEMLIDLITEKVEDLCGFVPSTQELSDFFEKYGPKFLIDGRTTAPLTQPTPAQRQTVQRPNINNQQVGQEGLVEIIVSVLQTKGGRATKAYVDDEIYRRFEKLFQEEYYQQLVANGIPRWKHNVAWAKERAKHLGYIKRPSESGRGFWELTESGIQKIFSIG